MRCVHSQREGAPDSTAAVTPKKFPSGVRNLHKSIEIQPEIWYNKPIIICGKDRTYVSTHDLLYPLVLQLPAGHWEIPDGFVYGISYALFGIDSLSGYVLASRGHRRQSGNRALT